MYIKFDILYIFRLTFNVLLVVIQQGTTDFLICLLMRHLMGLNNTQNMDGKQKNIYL